MKCLFKRYDIDGLDGDEKYYTFMQLTRKCKCEKCKGFLVRWNKFSIKRDKK